MSASLIGQFGSSAFRLSIAMVSTSLAGSCFSSESAPGPLYGTYLVKKFKEGGASFFFHQFRWSKVRFFAPAELRSPGGFERDRTLAIGMAIRGEPACGRDQSRHNLVCAKPMLCRALGAPLRSLVIANEVGIFCIDALSLTQHRYDVQGL
jgi:hypothetical protein